MDTILKAILIYSSTAIDLFLILMLFFANVRRKKEVLAIYVGQLIGSVSLIVVSLFFAYLLNFVPNPSLLALLGLIPLGLGLKVLIFGESDKDDELGTSRSSPMTLLGKLVLITIASCGADNIGVFTPYFMTLSLSDLVTTLITFLLMIGVLLVSAQLVANHSIVRKVMDRYSRWFIALVYILIGITVFIENMPF